MGIIKKLIFNNISELKQYKQCVYYIKNTLNYKLYIGSTSRTLAARMYEHFADKKKQQHLPLYQDMKQYGIENFEIGIIEDNIPLDVLLETEMEYITKFGTKNNGYNAIDNNGFTEQRIEELKERTRLINLGKSLSEETKRKLSESKKGRDVYIGKNNPSARKVRGWNEYEDVQFDTMKEACEYILAQNSAYKNKNIRSMSGAITQVCKGKRNKAYNYQWEYI